MEEKNSLNDKEQSLDEAFGELEQVISRMEGEVSLEESFRLYHKGMDMLKVCNEKIDKVEKKMMLMVKRENFIN